MNLFNDLYLKVYENNSIRITMMNVDFVSVDFHKESIKNHGVKTS